MQGYTINTSSDYTSPSLIPVSVLHVSSSERNRARLRYLFGSTNWHLTQASSFEEACSCLESEESITVIVCERQLRTWHWKDLLDEVMLLSDPPPFVVSSPGEDTEVWAEALNLGADDVLATPFEATELYWVLSQAHRSWLAARKPVEQHRSGPARYLITA